MSKFANDLEKKIKGKINAISKGTETVKDAGVNALITKLKNLDEAAAETLQKDYIAAVKKLAADKK
jgi:hypothetical protein